MGPARNPTSENADVLAPELMARVRQIQIRTHRMVSEALSGAYKSTFRGSGIEFEEVRPYQPGDDVRSIDWTRTARGREAFVKTYVEERELALSFLVDTSRSMEFGSRELTKRETAAQFCALLAYVALSQQDLVGLCLFGREVGLHLPPRKGAQSVSRVVREVIAAAPTDGASDFQAVLEHQGRALRRKGMIFLVSDFLAVGEEDSDRPKWSDTLATLTRRHDVIAVRVVDPFERALPSAGWLPFQDLESGRRVDIDTRPSAVRESWAAAEATRRARLAAILARARVDLIELPTERSIVDPVASFFRTRRSRRRGSA
jgi:uncharacterized protein (DUF58 family)